MGGGGAFILSILPYNNEFMTETDSPENLAHSFLARTPETVFVHPSIGVGIHEILQVTGQNQQARREKKLSKTTNKGK